MWQHGNVAALLVAASALALVAIHAYARLALRCGPGSGTGNGNGRGELWLRPAAVAVHLIELQEYFY